jgi:hypothetical protein
MNLVNMACLTFRALADEAWAIRVTDAMRDMLTVIRQHDDGTQVVP